MTRVIKYVDALREAHEQCMAEDKKVILMGLGATDPGGVFGSTKGLVDLFGEDRVMDMPLAENAMTGVAVGAAISGMRPIMTHQRIDFAMVAVEQIINQAAKWHYMFDGQHSVPMVIRMIVGRGWGQGPQHAQSLQAMFAHIPGLKVIMPATPYDAKGMMIAATRDENPVICIEHRWLYGLEDHVPEDMYEVPIGKARIMQQGEDITIVSVSQMSLEALQAARLLDQYNVRAEVIDLRTIRPLDTETILTSVQKTGRLLVVDTANLHFGISGELVTVAVENAFDALKGAPQRMGLPEYPQPTSPALAKDYYPYAEDIAQNVLDMLHRDEKVSQAHIGGSEFRDQPDTSFKGPF